MASQSARTARTLPEIPDKLYFRIGEVAKLCGVQTYVLRFWESEFPQLKPNKSGTGQRLYRVREVELARRIRTLLYDEGYTIAGARQTLQSESRKTRRLPRQQAELPLAEDAPEEARIARVRAELKEILGILSDGVSHGRVRGLSAGESASRPETGPELFD